MSIPESEQKKLFAKSGNRCAYPDCQKLLVAPASQTGSPVVLGEAAHIVAEPPAGPRGTSALTQSERNRYENLILLCSRHHQMVDADITAYSVEVLHRYKDEHEKWVERRMGPVDEVMDLPPITTDTVYSTLLPVERMPKRIFTAPCTLTPLEINSRIGQMQAGEMAPFIQRSGLLIAFQDLTSLHNPFAAAANPLEALPVDPTSWWNDPDKSLWYADLLNRTLNKVTGRRDLHWDKDHRRFYFTQAEQGKDREVTYRPLNRQSETRLVVWQPKRRTNGEARPYWFHRAISLRFIRVDAAGWALSLRPELRVTRDGEISIESKRIGGRVTKKKSRLFNYDLLGEIQFWRDFLGEGRPRISLSFGSPDQQLLISTNLLSCQVTWPGIPAEYAKAFRNVEYLDDLFTWAEAQPPDVDEDEMEAEDLDADF